MNEIIPIEAIGQRIFVIRGLKVMLDQDLAELYGVSTKRINEQVRRNKERFPDDFMFQLSKEEVENLRSQFATSSWGGSRYLPYAFTEHGVAMLSSVLKSPRAVQINILIIRAFIKLRLLLASNKELEQKIVDIEREQGLQNQHINKIWDVLNKLLNEPIKKPNKMGFELLN